MYSSRAQYEGRAQNAPGGPKMFRRTNFQRKLNINAIILLYAVYLQRPAIDYNMTYRPAVWLYF